MWTPQRREVVALVAMLDLALAPSEWTKSQAIAARHAIPPAFLEQIASRLCQVGLLRSRRGPTGGLRLARAPAAIRAIDVVHAVATKELENDAALPRTLEDLVQRGLADARSVLVSALADLTLERLAEQAEQLGLGTRPKSALSFDI